MGGKLRTSELCGEAMMIRIVLAAFVWLLAVWSASADQADATMRRLWFELQRMRHDPTFHAVGFAQGGPYARWMQELQGLIADRGYGLTLMARCEVVPGDLLFLAADYMNRRSTEYTERMTKAWNACFKK